MAEVEIGCYAPADSDEALALDAACAQGGALRLSFRRPTFHRRAERYPDYTILTARSAGRLVGTLAVAAKPASWYGAPARAAFAFDLRVAPSARGQGIATRLARDGLAWSRAHADLVYAYTVDDNRAAARVGGLMGLDGVGRYAYLVCPVDALIAGAQRVPVAVDALGYDEAHAAFVAAAGPFSLGSDPQLRPGDDGYVGSWRVRAGDGLAFASAFCHAGTLAEVIERVPAPLRALRVLQRAGVPWPRRWPLVPADGAELPSWFVFDACADGPCAGVGLVRAIAALARERGIDWLYVVHTRPAPWLAALRAALPRPFAPVLGYRLLLRHFAGRQGGPQLAPCVDVRDL